jgi:LysM domain-containing protein
VAFTLYREPTLFWFSLAALLIVWLAVRGARIAAVEWGDVAKASFDVFMPELATKLAFPPAATREEQERFWGLFGNIIICRSERALNLLNDDIDRLAKEGSDGFDKSVERTYTVQPGDTFGGIAKRFSVTVEALAKANDVDNTEDVVSVGQRLWVPHA